MKKKNSTWVVDCRIGKEFLAIGERGNMTPNVWRESPGEELVGNSRNGVVYCDEKVFEAG